jgi:SAM-dependent methyltransferase
MSIDLAEVSTGLERRDPGLWFARQQTAVSYPVHGNAACLAVEDRSFWFRHRSACIVKLMDRFPPDSPLLDVGGGNGYVAKALVQAGLDCVLLEPGIEGALAARARGVDPVICARLEECGLSPGSMGAVGMFDVLEHMPDDVAALRQVRYLMQPGGKIYLTVPAYPILFSADDKSAGHFRRYTIASLTRALQQAEFSIVFATYIFAPLPPLVFLLRTLPTWLGLARDDSPERNVGDHAPDGLAARLLDYLLHKELGRIASDGRIPFGGSCLCVAIRKSD